MLTRWPLGNMARSPTGTSQPSPTRGNSSTTCRISTRKSPAGTPPALRTCTSCFGCAPRLPCPRCRTHPLHALLAPRNQELHVRRACALLSISAVVPVPCSQCLKLRCNTCLLTCASAPSAPLAPHPVYTPCSSLAVHTLSHPQLLALRRSHARHNRMYGTSG